MVAMRRAAATLLAAGLMAAIVGAAASKCEQGSKVCHDGVYELDAQTCEKNFAKRHGGFGVTYEQMAARAPKVLQVDMAVPTWPAAARLGFVLKAHSADTLYSTERLLRWLYHPEYRFVVHFDRKGVSGELGCYFALKYAHLRNVALVPQIHAAWGHYGNSKAELLGFRMLHAMGGWDYAINLSGSTLPLVPPQALSCWVKSRLLDRGRVPGVVPTQNVPCCGPGNPEAKHIVSRTSATCLDWKCTRMEGTPDQQPWWKGSEWKILSNEFVDYVLTDPLAKRWLAFFRAQEGRTLNEAWTQTIAKHSPFNDRMIYDDRERGGELGIQLVHAEWLGRNCSVPNPRPEASPCFLTGAELPRILKANALFARKFFFKNSAAQVIKRDLVFPAKPSPLVDRFCSEARGYPAYAWQHSPSLP